MKEPRATDGEKQLLDRVRDTNSTEAEISRLYREVWSNGSRQTQIWREIDGAIAYKWGLKFSNDLSDAVTKITS